MRPWPALCACPALGFEEFRERVLVDGEAGRAGRVDGQVDREAVSVVQLERGAARDGRRRAADRRVEQLGALAQGSVERLLLGADRLPGQG
ncbi:hypothetical protein LUX73_36475 [Actinomadura madurae]|nr:hypothetical protein [Actinomadura madurae]MCQ0009662.1 hypothetical protein [Actinomadura madurae]